PARLSSCSSWKPNAPPERRSRTVTRHYREGPNVRDKDTGALHFLTAGHCTKATSGYHAWWYNGNTTYLGPENGEYYPTNDFGLVEYDNASVGKPGNVTLHDGTYQDIVYSRDATLYEYVCRSGFRTGVSCGYVEEKGVTANYPDGTVYGLHEASVNECPVPGDSGGAVCHETAALGIVSGVRTYALGTCTLLYQPVNEALAWYGMEVY
ncbi:S1 family peptidase, partial [Streptomyces chartreusis]